MSLKTQNQERAKFILENIGSIKSSNYVEKVSSYILTNGLLPTLVFLKSKEEGKSVYQVLNRWLKEKIFKNNNENDVFKILVNNSDAQMLRLATLEAQELANWMRRLVKAESGGNNAG